MTLSAGPPVGFVIIFSNGLRAYLSGDTGVTNEMDMVARLYRPSLAIINLNDVNTLAPSEAAFAMQQYIRPVTVMPTHVTSSRPTAVSRYPARASIASRGWRVGSPMS